MSAGSKQGCRARAKAKMRSPRAGLQFPVGCVHRLLRKGDYTEPASQCTCGRGRAPEGRDPAGGGKRRSQDRKARVFLRHVQSAIHKELNKLMGCVAIGPRAILACFQVVLK